MNENTTTIPEERAKITNYIVSEYAEIFWLDLANQEVTRANLTRMSLDELRSELKLIGNFRAREKHIYQNGYNKIIREEEKQDAQNTPLPNLNF